MLLFCCSTFFSFLPPPTILHTLLFEFVWGPGSSRSWNRCCFNLSLVEALDVFLINLKAEPQHRAAKTEKLPLPCAMSLWIWIRAHLEVTRRQTCCSFCSCSCTPATLPSKSHHWKSGARSRTRRAPTAWHNVDASLEPKVVATGKGLGDCWWKWESVQFYDQSQRNPRTHLFISGTKVHVV